MIPRSGRSPGEENSNPLQYSAWRIPWTQELGGLLSMGSQRIEYDRGINTFTLGTVGDSHVRIFRMCSSQNLIPTETSISVTDNTFWRASLVAQLVKNLPAMQETPVRFLGWEDPLEKGKAAHSSILPWRIPWTV